MDVITGDYMMSELETIGCSSAMQAMHLSESHLDRNEIWHNGTDPAATVERQKV
jgi:hypothetical protein